MPEREKFKFTLSVGMLKRRWNCSHHFIYNRIASGDIKAIKLGSMWKIDPESVENFENKHK